MIGCQPKEKKTEETSKSVDDGNGATEIVTPVPDDGNAPVVFQMPSPTPNPIGPSYDMTSGLELMNRPHAELTAEEVALKCIFSFYYFDGPKLQECYSEERLEIKKYNFAKWQTSPLRERQAEQTRKTIAEGRYETVVSSEINGDVARIIIEEQKHQDDSELLFAMRFMLERGGDGWKVTNEIESLGNGAATFGNRPEVIQANLNYPDGVAMMYFYSLAWNKFSLHARCLPEPESSKWYKKHETTKTMAQAQAKAQKGYYYHLKNMTANDETATVVVEEKISGDAPRLRTVHLELQNYLWRVIAVD